jgi:ferritin-like protein
MIPPSRGSSTGFDGAHSGSLPLQPILNTRGALEDIAPTRQKRIHPRQSIDGQEITTWPRVTHGHAAGRLSKRQPISDPTPRRTSRGPSIFCSRTCLQRVTDNDADFVTPLDMLAELRDDNLQLVSHMRETHEICDEHRDVATASLLETWIDEAEGRVWFLYEASRRGEP